MISWKSYKVIYEKMEILLRSYIVDIVDDLYCIIYDLSMVTKKWQRGSTKTMRNFANIKRIREKLDEFNMHHKFQNNSQNFLLEIGINYIFFKKFMYSKISKSYLMLNLNSKMSQNSVVLALFWNNVETSVLDYIHSCRRQNILNIKILVWLSLESLELKYERNLVWFWFGS